MLSSKNRCITINKSEHISKMLLISCGNNNFFLQINALKHKTKSKKKSL